MALSFQVRIALLVSAGVVPMLLAAYLFARQARHQDEAQVLQGVRADAAPATDTYEEAVQSAHGYLQAAARLTEVRAFLAGPPDEATVQACGEALRRLLADQDDYADLAVMTADGRVRCDAIPPDEPGADSAPRVALERNAYTLGWVPSPGPDATVPGVALPLRDASGGAIGAVYAAWRLPRLRRPTDLQHLAGGSFLLLVDRDGRVVDKQPDDPRVVGLPLADLGPFPALSADGPKVTDAVMVDGAPFVIATAPVSGAQGGVGWTVVGVPRAAAFAGVENFQSRLTVSSSGAVFLMLLTLAVSADRLLVRRMDRLTARADNLRAGSGVIVRTASAPDEFERISMAMDALQAARDRDALPLQLAVEASVEGVLLVSGAGRVVYANPSVPRILGVRLDQVVGSPLHTLLHGRDADHAEADCPLMQPARDGRELREEGAQFVRARGGVLPAAVVVRPVEDGFSTRGVVVVFEDQTWRRQVEVQLRQSAKMEALGQLASGVAHDFNNLLAAIIGSAEMLQAALVDRPRREVQDVLGAAERAASLTQQLLALSRRTTAEGGPASLNTVVREMERLLSRLVGAGVRVELELDPGVGLVTAGTSQLEQVLLNLVVNARDAMPDGGVLALRTLRAGPPDEVADGWVGLEVADSGLGMSSPVMSRIFEPFYTTKSDGTGLGLATVARVVEEVGGRVTVESAEGRGTTFRVYLRSA